jgi:carbon monoxide dehydrogenase subunit G
MLIEETFSVRAPIQQVWDFLLDIPSVSRCLPGCEEATGLDENTYQGILAARVGPVAARFKGKLTVTERVAPRRLVARGEGNDTRTASRARANVTLELSQVTDTTTAVVRADVDVTGKLGQFGHAMIREQAKIIFGQFTECARDHLEASAATGRVAADAAQPAPAPRPAPQVRVLNLLWRSFWAALKDLVARWRRRLLSGRP